MATSIPQSTQFATKKYQCRMCRTCLFTDSELVQHVPKLHDISLRKKKKEDKVMGHACSSYFLGNSMNWMGDVSTVEGKLVCPNPKCGARIGAFNWSGSQCSCGTWVAPSLQLVKSKLDVSDVVEVADS